MPQLTTRNIFAELERVKAVLQPDGRCVATPKLVLQLLERLQAYTDQVQREAEDEGLVEDTNVAQWARDMAAWQQRLARYFQITEAVPAENQQTQAGCEAIYEGVVAPLLDGIYYEVLPGIVLSDDERARLSSGQGHPGEDVATSRHPGGHSNAKPPDAATPFSLGNQVVVYREWQQQRWALLWDDMLGNAKGLLEGKLPFEIPSWVWWVAGGAGVAVVGTVGYGMYRRVRGRRTNPRRRRRRIR